MLKLVFFICLISARRWSESGQGIIYITGRERRRCSDHPFFTTNQGRGIGVIGLGLPLLAPAAETPGCVAFVLVFADGKNGICRGPVSEQRFYGLSILLL